MDRDRSGRRQSSIANSRSTIGFWVPLAITVSAATIGLAAWIWNERQHDDSEVESNVTDSDRHFQDSREHRDTHGQPPSHEAEASGSYVSRVSGALRRTPSPQQIYEGASKKIAAGAAVAGATIGSALAAIREEDKDEHHQYGHDPHAPPNVGPPTTPGGATSSVLSGTSQVSRSGSISQAPGVGPASKSGRQRTAAIVVSAEADLGNLNDVGDDIDRDNVVCIYDNLTLMNADSYSQFFRLWRRTLTAQRLKSSC
jgi:hypothetical protein